MSPSMRPCSLGPLLLLSLAPWCSALALELPLKYGPALGMMSKSGVTRYKRNEIKAVRSKEGSWWGDPANINPREEPGNRDRPSGRYGIRDFADNVSWGWHHPNGVYSTIPVGAPLIDADMNIYLSSDDSIRKFTANGELVWIYGPRGQLAAAPTLMVPGARRLSDVIEHDRDEVATEMELRPSWIDGSNGAELEMNLHQGKVRAGDRLAVRPGMTFKAAGKELYKTGDIGEVMRIVTTPDGLQKAMIHWPRTHHSSLATLASIGKRFVRVGMKDEAGVETSRLVGTTTSGYIFAVDLATGEELWATQACEMIAGVKGAVSGKNGIVVAATNRCVDRYCWKYRNLTNPFVPSNSIIRGMVASDGSEVWTFKPTSPVWNFVPQYSEDGSSVMFSDIEGTTYCLDMVTGALKWETEGAMGTTTQSFALYSPALNMIFAMGVNHYDNKFCNPFPAPGILFPCNTFPKWGGWVKGLNASSGRKIWEIEIPEPPSSAALGAMYSVKHTRLIIAMGHNCWYNSGSQLWALDPNNGHPRWKRDGPTLYTDMCAGDKEGGDIRRAMTGRAACYPGAWSAPVVDDYGDVYVGNQVGELQRWGTPDNLPGARDVELLSTLNTGVAFQDQAISFAPGMMAVTTCTSLIVFQTYAGQPSMSEDHDINTTDLDHGIIPGVPDELHVPLPTY